MSELKVIFPFLVYLLIGYFIVNSRMNHAAPRRRLHLPSSRFPLNFARNHFGTKLRAVYMERVVPACCLDDDGRFSLDVRAALLVQLNTIILMISFALCANFPVSS